MTITEWPEREIYSTDYLGAAYSTVPPNFTGPVLLKLDNKASRTACFPSEAEGNLAASMAVSELGGYNRAIVVPAPEDACVTHQTAHDWLFS